MKKFLLILGLVALLATMFVSCTRIEAGWVAVRVDLLGSEKGNYKVVGPGYHSVGANIQYFEYPTFTKLYPFTQAKTEGSPEDEAFYFQTKDGVKCNMDVSVQAHADAEKAGQIVTLFRANMDTIIHTNIRSYLRNLVQKYTSDMTIEDLYSNKKVTMIKSIEKDLQTEMAPRGIIIEAVSLISDIRFPPEIEASITAKIKATQEAMQRENELQKAKADSEIQLTQARADAESNKIKQQLLSQAMMDYNLRQELIKRWDGKLPVTVYGGGVSLTKMIE